MNNPEKILYGIVSQFNLAVNKVINASLWYQEYRPARGTIEFTIYYKRKNKNQRVDLEFQLREHTYDEILAEVRAAKKDCDEYNDELWSRR